MIDESCITALVAGCHELDVAKIQDAMRKLVAGAAGHDLLSERSYNTFFFGVLGYALSGPDCTVLSNLETGQDIVVKFLNKQTALIFEFDHNKGTAPVEKSEIILMDSSSYTLERIMRKQYASGLKGYKCLIIGLSFYGTSISNSTLQVVELEA
jgi:hypothetical protein